MCELNRVRNVTTVINKVIILKTFSSTNKRVIYTIKLLFKWTHSLNLTPNRTTSKTKKMFLKKKSTVE